MLPDSSSERKSFLLERLKSGAILETSHIIRDLINYYTSTGRLGREDKAILRIALDLLTEEISSIKQVNYKQADYEVQNEIKRRFGIIPSIN